MKKNKQCKVEEKTSRKLRSPKECLDNNGNQINNIPSIVSDISGVLNMVEKLNSSDSSSSSDSEEDNKSPTIQNKEKSISKYPYYSNKDNSKEEMVNKLIDIVKILTQLVEKMN